MTAYLKAFALLLLVGLCPLAQGAEPVAKVLLSIGKNQAVAADGQARPLKRQSPLYQGDRIETTPHGRVQLRFSDGSLLSLKADTQFAIDEYRFDRDAPRDGKAVYRLIKGGMRTVTGLIGHEEREDYRLETPVATIGIRGTHYSLHFCDASCAARTQQPEGLFGGVTQGGIHVDNGSGRHDIAVDDFFYVATTETEPEALLAPPELLVEDEAPAEESDTGESDDGAQATDGQDSEDTSGDSDQQDGSSDDGSAATEQSTTTDQGSTDSTGDGTTDTATSTDTAATNDATSATDTPTTTDTTTTTTGTSGTADTSGSLGDFSGTTADTLATTDTTLATTTTTTTSAPATDPNINPPPPVTSTLVSAPDGAALGVAFVEIDSLEGARAGGHLLYQGGNVSILLDDSQTPANIPVSITLNDPGTSVPPAPGCTPCVFDAASAALVDIGGLAGTGLGVNWGRWAVGWTLTENGVTQNHGDNMHFIYSPNRTGDSIVRGLTGVFNYAFVDGTLPTDELDNAGSYNSGNAIQLDFTNQMLLGIDLNVFVGGKVVNANPLHSLVPFDVFLTGEPVPLTGFCTGGSCTGAGVDLKGDMSLNFVGPNGERLIAAWGLFEDSPSMTSTVALSGTAAYDQGSPLATSTFGFAPAGSALMLAFTESASPGVHEGQLFSINSDFTTPIVIDSVGSIGNVPLYTHFTAFDTTGNVDCGNCEVSAGQATLVDDGGLSDPGMAVNWGRWDGRWAGTSENPMEIIPFGGLHYIFSPNTTPSTVVQSLTGSFTYSYVGGTQPTDEQGNLGTLSGTNQIGVDFTTQTITDVTLTMQVNGRNIGMNQQAPMPIDDALNNLPMALIGSCVGADCNTGTPMEGAIGIDFVGPNAERLVTSFGVNDTGTTPKVAVTGTAAFDR